ncbi:Outer membrane and periplasm component of type IV secretion of T-DNA complex [Candidatus Burkholderia verschuerenii]|uniref:Outer membrane and periplasm component of type IV secretion of T-DNA complex n=2 Tax=Candidatus Burkholderia verschuerenii TaxID=242163 RepID=A0A0L0MHT5_9BURK|nr:Outer membrane and periplasm component of type IV secretion of T-DNA complex [Candidatus Burkholderia verschuerenii]
MTVVTKTAYGGNRSYQFRLLASKRADDGASTAIFALSFNYPDDDRRARELAQQRANAAAAEQASENRLANAWAEGPRNWRYVAQGSEQIQPTEVSDNGRQTAFRFPGNMRVPTIYTAAPDGSETIVPYTMINDMAVVQTTARIFTLRDGQEVLRIINQDFDPVGRNPGTGTPDLSRTVRSGS